MLKIMKEKGQALVEMAIMLPIFLIMFLGVLEVGLAIRSYMIVLDASREGARYASKTYSMDLRSPEQARLSYQNIISHTSLNLDRLPQDNITHIIVTNIQIENDENFTHTGIYTVTSPINKPWYGSEKSQLNITKITQDLIDSDKELNEVTRKTPGAIDYQKEHGCIIVEIVVVHHQLLQFPVFTWADPITFHVFTMMRRNKGRE